VIFEVRTIASELEAAYVESAQHQSTSNVAQSTLPICIACIALAVQLPAFYLYRVPFQALHLSRSPFEPVAPSTGRRARQPSNFLTASCSDQRRRKTRHSLTPQGLARRAERPVERGRKLYQLESAILGSEGTRNRRCDGTHSGYATSPPEPDSISQFVVLATNGSSGAKRLVRALLADPLSSSAEWEASLLRMEDSSKGILIRSVSVHHLVAGLV
jgi:hypothetical protein